MTRGEMSPYTHARGDTEHYSAGLARARNVCVLRYGGVTRVPGTLFDGFAKNNDTKARFIRFEFNRSQVYAIEAGPLYFRFWTSAGRIEVATVPVEVVTPYLEADLKFLRVRQSGDVIYIWCRKAAGGTHQPRMLTRTSETVWTLSLYVPTRGPFLKEDTKGATMTPAGTGHLTPDMTGLTAPSGTVSSDNGYADAWLVFDREIDTQGNGFTGPNGWVQYRQAGSARKIADAWWFTASKDEAVFQDSPTYLELSGSNNGSTWVTLDTRPNETGWGNSETRYFEFVNDTAYEYYRISFRGGGGPDATGSRISEIAIHQKDTDQTPFNLVLSSAAAINNGAGFQTSDVGRVIRLMGGDGRWRVATIKARTNTTTVTVVIAGHALPDISPIARWQMGAFSEISGWPATGAIYEDRLFHARTDADPLGLWGSVNGKYDDFGVSSPVAADDGVSVRLTGGRLDDISWLSEQKSDMAAGTAGNMRAVGRNNDSEALGPSNFRQRAQTLAPSSAAEPVTIENVLLFIDYFEQRLYEAAYTYEVDGYLAREATTLSEHLYSAGIDQIAYLSHPHKIIVARRYDGKLVFFTYDREQKVAGSTLVDVGGEVEAIMDLPGDAETDLWMVVKRVINGTTRRCVERLAEFWREDFTVQGVPVYAASARTYSGAPVTGLTSLTNLNGATVGVWADGRDLGDAVVSGVGALTLPGGVSASEIVVGHRMPWHAQTLRLTQIGNQDGSGLGRKVTVAEAFLDLYEAAGVTVGTPGGAQDLMLFEDAVEDDPGDPVRLRTGMFVVAVDDNWRNNGVLDIQGDRMYPATIRAIQLGVEGEP